MGNKRNSTTSSSSTSNPFSANLQMNAADDKKGPDFTVEVVADWAFKTIGAVAAGVIIYNAVKKDK